MNQASDELIMYLEQSLVLDQGFINLREMTKANMQTIYLWQQEGLLELKTLNFVKKNFGPYTHKLRFSRVMYERAWEIRQKTAEKHCPTLNPDKQQTWTPDRDKPRHPERSAESPANETKSKDQYEPHFEGFKNFLHVHNNELTPVQEQAAREIFGIFEKKQFQFFMHGKHTGKSWLLKAIDQYLTSFRKNPIKKKKS